jgi:hypothetical protein
MRRAAKVDRNQAEIVKAFRDCGMTVQVLSAVGKGCPDTLVGFRGINVLVEIKDGEKPPSEQKLTQDQVTWHGSWAGQVCVANSINDAIEQVISVARAAGRV